MFKNPYFSSIKRFYDQLIMLAVSSSDHLRLAKAL